MKTYKTTLAVGGMSCASCAVSVESIAKAQKGFLNAEVNLATHTVQLEHDQAANMAELQQALAAMGYDLALDAEDPLAKAEEVQQNHYAKTRKQFIGAAILSAPVMVLGMFFMDIGWSNWLMFLLSTVVVFWYGRSFFKNAWNLLKYRKANMDSLVALSTGIAWTFSVFNMFYPAYWHAKGLHAHVYFESAAVIIAFILLGRLLEERAKSNTAVALRKLMGMQPQNVIRIRGDEQTNIPLSQLQTGEKVLVRAGEQLPIDGIIEKGSSFIDESMLSGESIPVAKSKGDRVFAGTINRDGRLEIIATGIGQQSLLAAIIKRVQQAQGSKAPVQQLIDKIAGIFVPIVLVIAVISFLAWMYFGGSDAFSHALLSMVTVLVIACPCALGLATPTAIMVGMGKGASQGLLIRDAASLETAVKITDLVLDKTGTITTGKHQWEAISWATADKTQLASWLAILLAIEEASDHPLATSIVQKLKNEGIQAVNIDQHQTHPGKGIEAVFAGEKWLAGSEAWLLEKQVTIGESLQKHADVYKSHGHALVWFAHNQQALAVIALADQLKEGTRQSLVRLQKAGIKVHLLSGDHAEAVAFMAEKAGINSYQAAALPEQKASFVSDLQAKGSIVAMVGDGINDSEALAKADLSIAMGSGSDIAIDVAGITILHNGLDRIETAIKLSKATVTTIRQNLFWAFIYNLIGIPLAAGLLYPINGFLLNPMLAAAAMALSSVSVVINSLLLQYRKI